MQKLENETSNLKTIKLQNAHDVHVNQLVCVESPERNEWGINLFRGQVLSINKGYADEKATFKVRFISVLYAIRIRYKTHNYFFYIHQIRFLDYGFIRDDCKLETLRLVESDSEFMDLPPRCFECSLAQLQPSVLMSPSGTWDSDAVKWFRNVAANRHLSIEVCRTAYFE